MDIIEAFSNNWLILIIGAIFLALIITFNEIRMTYNTRNYRLYISSHYKTQSTESLYSNYFHWYSNFNNDPLKIIINIRDKFLDCLEVEYQSSDIEYEKKLTKNEHLTYFLSQISDPELKSFIKDPTYW